MNEQCRHAVLITKVKNSADTEVIEVELRRPARFVKIIPL